MVISLPLFFFASMSKRSINNNSDSIPLAAQSTNKQRCTSTPAFHMARPRASAGTDINRSSRLTTIRTNARGWQGYRIKSQSLLSNSEPLSSSSINEGLPCKAISDLSLLDLGQPNDNFQTSTGPKPPKSKMKKQNTTSVHVLVPIYMNKH